LKFEIYVINIENLFQKFHGKKEIFNPWEVVKVGKNEIIFTTSHVGRF